METELGERLISNYQGTIPTHNEFQDCHHYLNFYDHKRGIIVKAVKENAVLPKNEKKSGFKNIRIQKKDNLTGKFKFTENEIREDFDDQIFYNEDEGHLILKQKGKKHSVFKISENQKIKKIQTIDFEKCNLM